MDEVDQSTQTFEEMVAGLKSHIYGQAEQGILDALKQSKNLAKDVGAMAFTLVQTATDQADQAGREYDLDMIMGVATEVIDDILELGEAAGIVEDSKDEALLEDCLFAAVEAYAQTAEPNSDEAEAAAQMLQQMADEGMVGEAESVIAKMGARQGVDPFADDDGVPDVDPRAQAQQPAPQPTRQLMAG